MKNLLKINSNGGVFIAPFQICPLAAGKGIFALPVNRAVDRPTDKFITVEPTIRPLGRPGLDLESNGSLACRPLGRSELDTESRVSAGRPVGRPGPFPESRSSLAVDRPGRPAHQPGCVHILCMSVNRAIDRPEIRCSLDPVPVDRAVDR